MANKKGAKDEPEDDRDDESSEDDAPDSSDEKASVERDESTKGVAKALGVDDDEDEAAEGEEEEPQKAAAPPNRAARRREEALKKRRGTRAEAKPATKASDGEDASEEEEEEEEEDEAEARPVAAARDPLPKDKNARAKELLRRRKEAAEGKTANIGLSAGEVVQDQIARAGGAAGRWFQRHFRKIIVGSVLGVVAVVGTIQYLNYREEQAGKTTDALMKGIASEGGRVFNDEIKDVRPEQYKAYDPTPVFTSFGARTDAALVSYTELAGKHAGSGLGVLAKLSEAGALLDKGQFQQAENAFGEVLKTDLAKADLDVKARALEGKAMAIEGRKDFDGAAAVFKELEAVDKAYEDIAKYHQARMHFRKGEKDQAKEILVALDKKLEIPTVDGPKLNYLRSAVGDYLRLIDPALARRANFGGTRGAITPEMMEMMQRKQLEMQRQQQEKAQEHGDEGPGELPMPGAEHGDDGTR